MTALKRAYLDFNKRWFNNTLPRDVTVKWATFKDMGDYDCDGERMTIRINRLLRRWPSAWAETLLHEMLHVATAHELADHGPAWRRERRRLYRAGAFEPYI